MTRRSRQRRRELTGPERRLWYAMRDRRLEDWKFRRQVPIGPYIADFYCHSARLVVEVDGDSHADRADSDRAREAWLEGQGLLVIRISNDEILHELEGIIERIAHVLGSRAVRHSADD